MAKTPRDIEQQLRKAILSAKVSRYELARITGVSEASLSLFVNGKRSLNLNTAAKVAKALRLELRPADGKGT